MIESETLPTAATDYLNEIEQQKISESQNIKKEIDLSGAKKELHNHVLSFITKSENWRRSSFETDWLKWQRAADGIFDPILASKKAAWQSKVHIDMTASHREAIHGHIFKTIVGVNPPVEIAARFNLGEADQSENIQAIIIRELDKAKWGIEIDKMLNDADTFGSGFIRRAYKTVIEKRKLRKEVIEQFTDNLNPMGMASYALRAATGKLKKSYQASYEDVITYRGVELKHISIWDIFPDPKALQVRGTTIACRFHETYECILRGIAQGYYLPSAKEDLKNEPGDNRFAVGNATVQADRNVTDMVTDKTDYQQDYEMFDLYGRMPKKWIYTILDEPFDDGEELVPARIIFHKKALVGVEINDDYEGEPTIDKFDYLPRNGSFFGGGIPWMLASPQAVVNEVVNQRLDNGAQALNHSFAVIEKSLVNPKLDLVSKPGQVIRLDAKYVPNGDVRNAFTQLQVNDTPIRAGFAEVNDAERWAQERTGSNRIMMGSVGTGRDGTKTLGEQQMLKEAGGEKFSYIGLRMEIDGLAEMYRGIWKTIYNHITPEDIVESIGEERAQNFVLVSPEELSRDYVYRAMGVFTMENKALRQSQIMQIRQAFLGAPWADDEAFFDASFRNIDEDPDKFKKDDNQIMQDQAAMIQPGIGPEQGMPGNSGNMPPGMPPQGQPMPGMP